MGDFPSENSTKTYCAAPWVNVRHLRGSSAVPCCSYTGKPVSIESGQTLEDVMAGPAFSELRQKMLNGEKIEGCRQCHQHDETGWARSERQRYNEQFYGVWREGPNIKTLEFNLGNLCNLRCRGCTSFASSKWTADEERLQRPVHPTVKGNLDVLKCSFKGLQHIKFIGGEPFLYEKEHESILRYLNENTDISRLSLEYATNATKRVSPEVLEIWRKVKYVQIGFSVDAYGARNDYFRHGSKWDEVMANVRWFRENVLPNWRQHFHFHTVVNIYNIHELAGFDDYLTGEFPGMSLSKDFLSEPLWLDICNLPDDEKELLGEYYEEQSQRADITRMRRDHYSYIVKRLKEPPAADFYQFVVEEMKVNKLWGYHLQDYHPRLAALVESTGL